MQIDWLTANLFPLVLMRKARFSSQIPSKCLNTALVLKWELNLHSGSYFGRRLLLIQIKLQFHFLQQKVLSLLASLPERSGPIAWLNPQNPVMQMWVWLCHRYCRWPKASHLPVPRLPWPTGEHSTIFHLCSASAVKSLGRKDWRNANNFMLILIAALQYSFLP